MKTTWVRVITLLVSVALMGANADAAIVTFNDAALEGHVRTLIGKPTGDVLDTDVNAITSLTIDGLGISDLTGLEFFTGLGQLTMDDNNVSDLTPIGGLTGIFTLHIRNNPITDLSPITTLTILVNFRLGTPAIIPDFTSINALNLFLLEIDGPTLANINALAPSTSLNSLNVSNLGITDISAVSGFTNLASLNIEGNNVTSLASLSSLNSLQSLAANGNSISDVSGLTGLPALQNVRLADSPLADLSPLATLPVLDLLDIGNTGTSSLAGLTGASTSLTNLTIFDNTITDLTPLAGLTGLQTLVAGTNAITSADGLAGLPNLQTLNLIDNQVTDISALVLNTDFGAGDTVQLFANPLPPSALCTDVATLRARGALVLVTTECDSNLYPCPLWPTLNQQGNSAYPVLSLDWQTDDSNGDGIPDRWQARLVGHVVCDTNHALNSLAVDVLAFNLGSLAAESSPLFFTVGELHDVRHLFAALILVSDAGRSNITTTLGLVRPYVTVDLSAKSIDEPFSGSGDLDGDGTTNLQEYLNVIANGGGELDFVLAATSAGLNGSESLPATSLPWRMGLVCVIAVFGALLLHKRYHRDSVTG